MVDASELSEEDLPKENGGLLVISQSGETKDVNSALALAQQKALPCFSVVNMVTTTTTTTQSILLPWISTNLNVYVCV